MRLSRKTKNSKLICLMLALLLLTFSFVFTGCGSDDEVVTDDDIDYMMNEGDPDGEEADPKKVAKSEAMNKSADNFVGTWTATSEYAVDQYGSLEFTINENGTFNAKVTGEDFSGTWTKADPGIKYSSEYMKGNIYFGSYGKAVLENDMDGDIIRVTINKTN